jgi:TRAP-type C4-dicarboxylate transport system substrate-binding protein
MYMSLGKKTGMRLLVALMLLVLAQSVVFAAGAAESPAASGEKKVVVLNGASMFDVDHPYTQTLIKFEELVNKYQDEVVVEVRMNLNRSLGIESDYLRFMSQGESVDLAIIAPAHTAQRVPSIAILDMPLLFRDFEHREAVLNSNLFDSITEEIIKKARIRPIGYAGGASRNIISNYPIRNMQELKGFKLRVQGAPIWAKVFSAVGAVPSVIAYDEVYSAIQTRVIDGLENEKVGYAQMRFFEVAKHFTENDHSITVRPLYISETAYQKLSPTVQQAVLKAGAEAGAYGAQFELDMADSELQKLVDAGLAVHHKFSDADKAEFRRLATPALLSYVDEMGFRSLYEKIQTIK